jgi:hypothetical protein
MVSVCGLRHSDDWPGIGIGELCSRLWKAQRRWRLCCTFQQQVQNLPGTLALVLGFEKISTVRPLRLAVFRYVFEQIPGLTIELPADGVQGRPCSLHHFVQLSAALTGHVDHQPAHLADPTDGDGFGWRATVSGLIWLLHPLKT